MIISDERAAQFLETQFGTFCPPYTCMGIVRDGEVTGAVLFNQFEGADVHVTAAGRGWTSGFLRAVGDYVYGQLGCERMTMTTEYEGVARYAERLGARREGVLRSHFGRGRDAIVLGVLQSEWLCSSVSQNQRG